ncbi:DUF2938 domain-containing protein [Ramlibacter algicola]|uniref:DUF2938 domain-containing protein n=1 Tax=Ramlibacter algicola TaxID=2795217 RepID=A0A934US37_9BURK|nr:DUF2938 domain-containing protein [Ramlibacter algicola]MBK0393820.1 DUF2938 domain-containing protein [Ramlibacter algicola]
MDLSLTLLRAAAIGVGATAVMDLWLVLLRRLGVPTMDFALIGRWAGHLAKGQVRHDKIARSPAIPGERALGWAVHYATGVAFAAVLVLTQGTPWTAQPTLVPALLTGFATVAAPLLVMQPSMGAGIAASKTPTPLRNVARSVANHTVFGIGLYLAAACIAFIAH